MHDGDAASGGGDVHYEPHLFEREGHAAGHAVSLTRHKGQNIADGFFAVDGLL